jgi:hypothetical protein
MGEVKANVLRYLYPIHQNSNKLQHKRKEEELPRLAVAGLQLRLLHLQK